MLDGLKRFLGFKVDEDSFEIKEMTFADPERNGFYIVRAEGDPYAGPYKRAADAKGQLTRMRKQYTPAARRA